MTIVKKKKSPLNNVYLHFDDGEYYMVKKLTFNSYMSALSICKGENPDFLYLISRDTGERDVYESYCSVNF